MSISNNIEIKYEAPESLLCQTDPQEIEQIIINLTPTAVTQKLKT